MKTGKGDKTRKSTKAGKESKPVKSKKAGKESAREKAKKSEHKGSEVKPKVARAPKTPDAKSKSGHASGKPAAHRGRASDSPAQSDAASRKPKTVKAASKPKTVKTTSEPKTVKSTFEPKTVNETSEPKAGAIHARITNREFKLLLNPEGLDRRSRVMQLDSLVVSFARQSGFEFFHNDNANTGLRNVIFYDTPGEDLRRSNLILRVRESRQNVWVDDWCEVTFKCRAHDFETAAAFDPTPDVPHRNRMRFKEEILRGDGIGSSRQIFSNNAVLDSVPVDKVFGTDFASASKFFPNLKQLELSADMPVRIVGGKTNKILEACLPLGTVSFGTGVQAHVELAIWMRSVGEPIIGELAYAYRVTDENRNNVKAHQKADQFFRELQPAISDWLATGTTKTALVYGKPE